MIKIMNDALLAADQGMVTLVVLLDYSAAFDTVDHSIALSILEHNFGVTSSSLLCSTVTCLTVRFAFCPTRKSQLKST